MTRLPLHHLVCVKAVLKFALLSLICVFHVDGFTSCFVLFKLHTVHKMISTPKQNYLKLLIESREWRDGNIDVRVDRLLEKLFQKSFYVFHF
ncbi:hypothetical protein T4D_13235 [Trichinella pseudospiralis]|uniref:Uncharacterized protein n=1 Tax=Trichinella pseudospiralis TaxID=6337 RepID=A0A0V1FD51_TRIPS|nr:hypothetical protein T4D_5418 [Trichinella pseudospiralis]KRY86967.1 hypothetical protein T4D_13235 [Trichinella pseudospiralis]